MVRSGRRCKDLDVYPAACVYPVRYEAHEVMTNYHEEECKYFYLCAECTTAYIFWTLFPYNRRSVAQHNENRMRFVSHLTIYGMM